MKPVSLMPRRCPVGSQYPGCRPTFWIYSPRGCCSCRENCLLVSDAARVVPIRGLSPIPEPVDRPLTLAPGRSKSKRGGRAARTEADLPAVVVGTGPPWLPFEELCVLDLSVSGGGVGGKRLRFNGGSECCRLSPMGVLLLSEAAINLAFPR